KALQRSWNQPALRKQQREWLRNVRDKCADAACLTSAYRSRRSQFEWSTANDDKHAPCEEFRLQKNRRLGLTRHALPEQELADREATHAIRTVDIDGDGKNDQILIFRTGSASHIPPDNSWLSVVLSTTGEDYKVEAQWLYAIKYKSRHSV